MNLIYEKWDEILEYMRTDLEMTTLSFNTWIKPLKIHSLENNILRILVEMDGAVEYLEKKYKVYLQAAVIDVIQEKYDIEATVRIAEGASLRDLMMFTDLRKLGECTLDVTALAKIKGGAKKRLALNEIPLKELLEKVSNEKI